MKRMKELLENQGGFTLIELMIALVVISVVIVGFIGANVLAQRNNEDMHERTTAVQDANRAIEQMRNISRTGTFPANVVAVYPNNSTLTGFDSLPNEEVTASYANATANPLDVTITVTWLSYSQRASEEVIRTYITQR